MWNVPVLHVPTTVEVVLQELIPVDIFGNCGTGTVERGSEEEDLVRRYKFYFAFENSLCRDYISEKFFRIQYFIVPIVLKRNIYTKFFSPKGEPFLPAKPKCNKPNLRVERA